MPPKKPPQTPRLPLLARLGPAVPGEAFGVRRRMLEIWKQPVPQAGYRHPTAPAAPGRPGRPRDPTLHASRLAIAAPCAPEPPPPVASFSTKSRRSLPLSRGTSPNGTARLGGPRPDNARPLRILHPSLPITLRRLLAAVQFDDRAACNPPLAGWLTRPGGPTITGDDTLRDNA